MDIEMSKVKGMSKLRATVWFWSVTLIFAGLWMALPSLLHSAYKADTIELQFIAKEWVWSTTKHPMMSAWLLEICNILTHRAFAAPFIASAFCTVIILFSVWRLARNVLPEEHALLGTFVMLPYLPLTLKSCLYNPNTALMLFWTLAIFTFYYAFQTNKKRWWIAAGLSLGLGFHAKYVIVLLVIALLFYSLWFPRFRRYWTETGPWLTVMISFAVFVPHLIWLYRMESPATAGYVFNALDWNAVGAQNKFTTGNMLGHLTCPILFILGEFALIAVSPILLLVPSLGWRWKRRTIGNETEKETLNYLLCCIGIPLLLLIGICGIKEIVRTTYGFPLWFFLGVWLLLRLERRDCNSSFVRSMKWIIATVSVFVVVFMVQSVYGPHITGKPSHVHYPMREIGVECDRIWYSRFDTPCRYVSGSSYMLCGFASYSMKDQPSAHCYDTWLGSHGPVPIGTWATDADVKHQGGIIIWETPDLSEPTIPDWLRHRFPRAEVVPEVPELPYKTNANIPPLRIGVALLPPASNPSSVQYSFGEQIHE